MKNQSHVTRHTSHVTRHTSHVTRHSSQAREARLKLPIVGEEQPLMDLVHHRTCVVLQVRACVRACERVYLSYAWCCRAKLAAASPPKFLSSFTKEGASAAASSSVFV